MQHSLFSDSEDLLPPIETTTEARAPRQNLDFNADWRFLNEDAAPDVAAAEWEPVAVPHTWNADNYDRGARWYAKDFEAPTDWQDKRIFARFEAVSLVADIYLNGEKIAHHVGGFTAFCVELTPHLKIGESNEMRVRADNSYQEIAPIWADFNFGGGIYRPVHLIVTDVVCISPLDFASSGVSVTQQMDGAHAEVDVTTLISNGGAAEVEVPVAVAIFDAEGQKVADAEVDAKVCAATATPVVLTLSIPDARLWNGKIDPYLYRVQVTVGVDTVEQTLGVRTVEFDDDGHFRLNGERYALNGVNRHQDWQGLGYAISNAEHDRDVELINKIGATAVRMAHYPQCEYFLDAADREGWIVWEEVPVVNETRQTAHFEETAKSQLTEMIKQHAHHPSIFTWGLYNELRLVEGVSPAPFVAELNDIAHGLDKSRPTAGATFKSEMDDLNDVADILGFNLYPGWYGGDATAYGEQISKKCEVMRRKTITLSEYGAGASVFQHQEGAPSKVAPKGQFHPEEYQTFVHQEAWKAIQNNPQIWGSFVWNMFDFAVSQRDEGDRPNANDKGLVTFDRQIGKDSFYFYKANWNPEPMIYIAARRLSPRARLFTEIQVFSTADEVELKVNGVSIGTAAPDEIKVFRWENVVLQMGSNLIEAHAAQDGATLTDSCEWVVERSVSNTVAP